MKKVLNKKQKKEKRKQLKNSRPLDIYKTSDFPEAISAIDEIYAELKKAKLVSKRYSKKWRDQ